MEIEAISPLSLYNPPPSSCSVQRGMDYEESRVVRLSDFSIS
mgnify:CR=1 FL=1